MTNPGLCATCAHCRLIDSAKGSRFYLCQLGVENRPGFRKYPPLPVLRCNGFRDDARAAGSAKPDPCAGPIGR